jgi:hypothetical protein
VLTLQTTGTALAGVLLIVAGACGPTHAAQQPGHRAGAAGLAADVFIPLRQHLRVVPCEQQSAFVGRQPFVAPTGLGSARALCWLSNTFEPLDANNMPTLPVHGKPFEAGVLYVPDGVPTTLDSIQIISAGGVQITVGYGQRPLPPPITAIERTTGADGSQSVRVPPEDQVLFTVHGAAANAFPVRDYFVAGWTELDPTYGSINVQVSGSLSTDQVVGIAKAMVRSVPPNELAE